MFSHTVVIEKRPTRASASPLPLVGCSNRGILRNLKAARELSVAIWTPR